MDGWLAGWLADWMGEHGDTALELKQQGPGGQEGSVRVCQAG